MKLDYFIFILFVLAAIYTLPVIPSSPTCTASADYCTSPPSNFSPSGRIRVGPDYVVWLYCSLPFGVSAWNYEDTKVTLNHHGNNITVAGGTFNFTFEVEDEDENDDGDCITTIAKVDFIPQNLSTGTFLEMNCSGFSNTMAIPVTVEVVEDNSVNVSCKKICPGVFNITWDAKEPMCDQETIIYNISVHSSKTGKLILTNLTSLTRYTASKLPDEDKFVFSVIPLAADNISDSTVYEPSTISADACLTSVIPTTPPSETKTISTSPSTTISTPTSTPTSQATVVAAAGAVSVLVVIVMLIIGLVVLILIWRRQTSKDSHNDPEDSVHSSN